MDEEFVAVHAKGHHRIGKLRVIARDDDVERPDQHESARNCLALNSHDDRLGQVAPAPAEAEIDLLLARHMALRARVRIAAEAQDRRP